MKQRVNTLVLDLPTVLLCIVVGLLYYLFAPNS